MDDNEVKLLDCVAMPIFALEVDEARRPIYAAYNRTAQAASRMSVDDVVGKTAKEIYPGRFGEIAYQRHVEAVRSVAATTYELTLPLGDSIRRVRTTLEPLLDDDGNVVRLIGTSADITAEHLIRETQANAEILSSETEQFVSMAAHDLRSPMRRISFLASMLREGFEDLGDGKLELIDKLEDAASKTITLISDVLAYAQATNATPERGEFDFGRLCADVLVTLDPTAQHTASYNSGRIEGDVTATQIVLRNLIDNALKHSGIDHVALTITLANMDHGMFQVTIRDNGRGFEDPAMAFLGGGQFRHGSGFGLMGIRRLIMARGGTIVARVPGDGCGAIITFTLPGQVVALDMPEVNSSAA